MARPIATVATIGPDVGDVVFRIDRILPIASGWMMEIGGKEPLMSHQTPEAVVRVLPLQGGNSPRQCEFARSSARYFAVGSGRSWNFTILATLSVPPSVWNVVRVPHVV